MAYGRRYGGSTRSRTRSGGNSRWMALRYAGTCKVCAKTVEAGQQGYWDASARTVTCSSLDCARADGLTEVVERWAGNPDGKEQLRATRIGDGYHDPFAKTRSRGYYGIDAGRCEDAPCCGCCD